MKVRIRSDSPPAPSRPPPSTYSSPSASPPSRRPPPVPQPLESCSALMGGSQPAHTHSASSYSITFPGSKRAPKPAHTHSASSPISFPSSKRGPQTSPPPPGEFQSSHTSPPSTPTKSRSVFFKFPHVVTSLPSPSAPSSSSSSNRLAAPRRRGHTRAASMDEVKVQSYPGQFTRGLAVRMAAPTRQAPTAPHKARNRFAVADDDASSDDDSDDEREKEKKRKLKQLQEEEDELKRQQDLILSRLPTGGGGLSQAPAMEETPFELEEILATPAFRAVFAKFLENNHCLESLQFLDAEQAFQSLQKDKRGSEENREYEAKRSEAVKLIATKFLGDDCTHPVNINAAVRKRVLADVELSPVPFQVLEPARDQVYRLLSNDIFKRFLKSVEYDNMVRDPASWASKTRERSLHPSFSLLAKRDNSADLDRIGREWASTSFVKERRRGLNVYPQSFKGSELVDWLLNHNHATNRAMAVGLGQRLYYAAMIRHVTLQHEFEDTNYIYTFMPKSHKNDFLPARDLSVKKTSHSGYVLVKGMTHEYHRFFVVVSEKNNKLYIYRDKNSLAPSRWFKLLFARCRIQAQLETDISSTESSLRTSSEPNLNIRRLKSFIFVDEHKPSRCMSGADLKEKANAVSYMHLRVRGLIQQPATDLTLRMESDSERMYWMRAFVCTGVKITQWELLTS